MMLFVIACEPTVMRGLEYNQIHVKVNRGAFSYDTFTLNNEILQYNVTEAGIKYENQNKPGEKYINSSDVIEFAKYIVDNGFFTLEDKYTTETTDKSSLIVEVEIDGIKKQVFCEDFERGCPPLVNSINRKLQELYGQDLLPTKSPG